MAMAIDSRQQSHLAGLPFDTLRYPPAPNFTNPWGSAVSGTSTSQLYPTSLASNSTALESTVQTSRPASMSMPFAGVPVTASSLGPGITLSDGLYEPQDLLSAPQDLLNPTRSYANQYATSSSPNTYAATTTSQYPVEYSSARASYPSYQDRRSSHPLVPSAEFLDPETVSPPRRHNSLVDFNNRMQSQEAQRSSFSDALDASRGMVAMSQDITPRNIYGNQNSRNSADSYGFPSTHSAHSSISSASYNPSYYAGSVGDSSVTDYSSASESVDANPRTLPRPSALVGTNLPPAPQSMMGQFSSKVSSSSQKKHKCKICEKRFTRPSSLQTHMYSHTGEKPFACEVDGCGRHFSVVSNLRRHRKVHKGEHDHPSPDDS